MFGEEIVTRYENKLKVLFNMLLTRIIICYRSHDRETSPVPCQRWWVRCPSSAAAVARIASSQPGNYRHNIWSSLFYYPSQVIQSYINDIFARCFTIKRAKPAVITLLFCDNINHITSKSQRLRTAICASDITQWVAKECEFHWDTRLPYDHILPTSHLRIN